MFAVSPGRPRWPAAFAWGAQNTQFIFCKTTGATHERSVTGGGPASVKLEKFRAVNTLFGNLKTALSGTYHAFNFTEHAHCHLAEVQYRFNRRFDLSVILARLIRAS